MDILLLAVRVLTTLVRVCMAVLLAQEGAPTALALVDRKVRLFVGGSFVYFLPAMEPRDPPPRQELAVQKNERKRGKA